MQILTQLKLTEKQATQLDVEQIRYKTLAKEVPGLPSVRALSAADRKKSSKVYAAVIKDIGSGIYHSRSLNCICEMVSRSYYRGFTAPNLSAYEMAWTINNQLNGIKYMTIPYLSCMVQLEKPVSVSKFPVVVKIGDAWHLGSIVDVEEKAETELELEEPKAGLSLPSATLTPLADQYVYAYNAHCIKANAQTTRNGHGRAWIPCTAKHMKEYPQKVHSINRAVNDVLGTYGKALINGYYECKGDAKFDMMLDDIGYALNDGSSSKVYIDTALSVGIGSYKFSEWVDKIVEEYKEQLKLANDRLRRLEKGRTISQSSQDSLIDMLRGHYFLQNVTEQQLDDFIERWKIDNPVREEPLPEAVSTDDAPADDAPADDAPADDAPADDAPADDAPADDAPADDAPADDAPADDAPADDAPADDAPAVVDCWGRPKDPQREAIYKRDNASAYIPCESGALSASVEMMRRAAALFPDVIKMRDYGGYNRVIVNGIERVIGLQSVHDDILALVRQRGTDIEFEHVATGARLGKKSIYADLDVKDMIRLFPAKSSSRLQTDLEADRACAG